MAILHIDYNLVFERVWKSIATLYIASEDTVPTFVGDSTRIVFVKSLEGPRILYMSSLKHKICKLHLKAAVMIVITFFGK